MCLRYNAGVHDKSSWQIIRNPLIAHTRNLESTERFFFLNLEGSLCNCLSSDQMCKLQGRYTEYLVLTLLRTKEPVPIQCGYAEICGQIS